VNKAAVERAWDLIDARQYVLESDWGDVQPSADAQNDYLKSHSWDDYAEWHLGLTDDANDETKANSRLRRLPSIASQRSDRLRVPRREWRHKDVDALARATTSSTPRRNDELTRQLLLGVSAPRWRHGRGGCRSVGTPRRDL